MTRNRLICGGLLLLFTLPLFVSRSAARPAAHPWRDVSMAVMPGKTPTYPGNPAITFTWAMSLDRGDVVNLSDLHFGAHSGTHIDAPLHFIKNARTIDQIPLDTLIGPALVVECGPDVRAIDAAELRRHRWRGATRILFKTRNSTANLIADPVFHKDFTYIAPDAAKLLVANGVKLVGIDYLSIEKFGATHPDAHLTLLGANVAVVEGLDLRGVHGGWYDFICLPARFKGREAAPARAVLRER